MGRLFEPWAITLGRFRVPGGFWLIADGGALSVRRGALELAVYGGARSFTNGRVETLLTSSPHYLPLVGAAITRRGDVQATLAYTYTRDRLVLPGVVEQPAEIAGSFAEVGRHDARPFDGLPCVLAGQANEWSEVD